MEPEQEQFLHKHRFGVLTTIKKSGAPPSDTGLLPLRGWEDPHLGKQVETQDPQHPARPQSHPVRPGRGAYEPPPSGFGTGHRHREGFGGNQHPYLPPLPLRDPGGLP